MIACGGESEFTPAHCPRPFTPVGVFTDETLPGNPLAVVLDAVGLSTEHMQCLANRTNLSETRSWFRRRIPTPTTWSRNARPAWSA
ncbi:PhzF family phenazine biosynthesis protein [Pseudarthrobacter sp. S3]|uniref:PhzF family phenazine biosynthesis protein n=1 Tax=Pseudarthrobacter sp. S3 TaxID=3418419 RepID=UPI003CEBE1C3